MSNEANTREPEGADPEAAAKAEALVGEADELLADALAPGRWPEAEVAERFLSEGKLDRVLALYGQAMRFNANEPAYPWNLASGMNRLGLNDLALAEVAIDAGEYDLALTALAHARADDGRNGREAQIGDLLKEVRRERNDPQPQASLASLLEQLPA